MIRELSLELLRWLRFPSTTATTDMTALCDQVCKRHVIVPVANSDTSELPHAQTREGQKMKMNCSKSKKTVFAGRGSHAKPVYLHALHKHLPSTRNNLSAADAVNVMLKFAVRTRVSSVTMDCQLCSLQDVFRVTVTAKITILCVVASMLVKRSCFHTTQQVIWNGYCADDSDVQTNY